MSFISTINALKIRLENNGPLNNFCIETFGKPLSVTKVFRDRTAINMTDLPLILITRPRVGQNPAGSVPKREHSVALYAGFRQQDLELALDQSIEFPELIEAAAVVRTELAGDMGFVINLSSSVNDEGLFHPVYFTRMDFTVKDR